MIPLQSLVSVDTLVGLVMALVILAAAVRALRTAYARRGGHRRRSAPPPGEETVRR